MRNGLIGIIGGSGLGQALAGRIERPTEETLDTPFGSPSGPIRVGTLGAHRIAFIHRHGSDHTFNPSGVPYAANIFALKTLGATAVIAGGAVGSLRETIHPGQLVLADQFIDKTFRRKSSFFDEYGAVHVEFSQPCCGRLRQRLLSAAEQIEAVTHADGTYVCMEGPQFSTRAESLMHRNWGGDLIGMTAMPEAKLAREAQMCYALIALVSDYDCWREHDPAVGKKGLLEEILANLNHATHNAVTLIETLLADDRTLCDDDCGCRNSLDLAVWSKPDAINPDLHRRLSPLFA